MPFRTVVGVGVGTKLIRGRVAAREAIVVLVGQKLPRKDVPKGELIPPTFGGFPTDVREPVLMIPPEKEAKGRKRPRPAEWCLTDPQWIDWAKIHELNIRQQREAGRASDSPKPRGRRGTSND